MSYSAQKTIFLRIFSSLVSSFIIAFLFGTLFVTQTFAQSVSPSAAVQQTVKDFRIPDADNTVPRNNHAYTQIVMIDVLSAVMCQITGIDPVMPTQPCVSFNPLTGKYGMTQTRIEDKPQLGGALGVMAQQIGVLYQKPLTSKTYFDYLSANFGIVKQAYAQQTANCSATTNYSFGYGYCGLSPIFEVWKLARDLAYALMVIAFVVLALGIMLRFKIDARTVMTLQNQIPRVIIAILLITFSYAIAGVLIDLMWTVTYMGMNAITSNTQANVCLNDQDTNIGNAAPLYLLQTPLHYVNSIFSNGCTRVLGSTGLITLANNTGGAIGNVVTDLIFSSFGSDFNPSELDCSWHSPSDCFKKGIALVISLIIKLIVIVALLITLVRLWFQLLKTVVLFIVYTVEGPIWIVFGLLPGRPLGFEKWLRLEFAHLVAFPLVAWALTFARILAEAYPSNPAPDSYFIPPLIGNPNMNNFGALLAFGLVLITPSIPDVIKEKMKVPPGKMGGRIQAGFAAGAAVTAASSGAGWKRLTRRHDPETGKDAGSLRQWFYGRPLGMNKAKTDAAGKLIPTRRYKFASKWLFGGEVGVQQERGKK